jgi:hypothetical protein
MSRVLNSFQLALLFCILGGLFSSRKWILFLDTLSPRQGLVIYYTIIYTSVYLLSLTGLVIGHSKITNYTHTLGIVMILFSFFIIFNWESEYINLVTKSEFDTNKISNIYLQSEDGATFDFYYTLTKNQKLSRILTFIVTPFILTFSGSLLITEKIKLGF